MHEKYIAPPDGVADRISAGLCATVIGALALLVATVTMHAAMKDKVSSLLAML